MTTAASSAPAPAAADGAAAAPTPTAPAPPPAKIDPVTQVQDAIDGLALSLFEALRGIRDATAPEALVGDATSTDGTKGGSGTKGGGGSTSNQDEADFDDFLIAYHNQEPHALEVAKKAGGKPPQSKEDYLKVLARMDFESDVGTAQRLAGEILDKSREVEELVDHLPGMERSKKGQMDRIATLIEENRTIDRQLEEKHREASEKRDQVRTMLREVTCSALGIEEE